jgi:hypothetical protein
MSKNKEEQKKSLFSEEEIRKLNKETNQKDLEDFFYNCLLSNGKSDKLSREKAIKWSKKMTEEDLLLNEIEKDIED